MRLPPQRWAPAGALKVTDKASDGVAYLYATPRGRPAALGYHGKAQRPDFHLTFANDEAREAYVRRFFAGRQARAAMAGEQKAKAAAPSKLQLGHVLVSSWGYDQTNVDWYQVTRIVGPHTVEIRPICGHATDGQGGDRGHTVPAIDHFKGEPKLCRVRWGDQVAVGHQHARLWDGRPHYWSSYA